MQTVHELLRRLVSDPHARAAFDADPFGCLDCAGLGDLTTAQFRHAASLLFDFGLRVEYPGGFVMLRIRGGG